MHKPIAVRRAPKPQCVEPAFRSPAYLLVRVDKPTGWDEQDAVLGAIRSIPGASRALVHGSAGLWNAVPRKHLASLQAVQDEHGASLTVKHAVAPVPRPE